MNRVLFFVAFALAALSTAHGQSSAKKDSAGEVEILFANGSLVRLTLVQDKLEVQTLYGNLSVPVRDIRRIDFGRHVPDGVDQKVEAAIKRLASNDYKERDGAVQELLVHGPYAYAALLTAAKNTDLEVAKRATETIARIRAKVSAKELKLAEDDRVVTGKFTIVGRIVTPSIKARTEYFGDAKLTLPQLRQMRVLADAKDAEVTVDAAKYGNPNEWLETSVSVDTSSILSISATGQVDLSPQMPGNIVCGPQGVGPGGGGFAGPGGAFGVAAGGMVGGKGKKGAIGPAARNSPGALLGRIGEDGEVFYVGARFEGVVGNEGRLYLHINPTQFDTTSTGTYSVRISTRN